MTERIPAEVFPPGEFLRDELEVRGWTQAEFAEIINRSTRLVNEIIAGKRGVTPDTARAFAAALGTSAQLWMNLETTYQLSKVAPTSESIAQAARLSERFPVREMVKRRWIEASENVEVLEKRLLDYFKIKSIRDDVRFSHAARKNSKNEKTDLQLVWLFRVRQLAHTLRVSKYSKETLMMALNELEALMEEPEEIRNVPRIFEQAGVRLVIVEALPNSRIQGACFWINNEKSPVIGLSLNYGRIDNFWFNLRHEIEHVLNGDGKTEPMLDDKAILFEDTLNLSDKEKHANDEAAEFCVPQQKMDDFVARFDPIYSTKNVVEFAHLVKRHPGIIVGQLHRKTGRYNLLRNLQVDIRKELVGTALTDGFGKTHIVTTDKIEASKMVKKYKIGRDAGTGKLYQYCRQRIAKKRQLWRP